MSTHKKIRDVKLNSALTLPGLAFLLMNIILREVFMQNLFISNNDNPLTNSSDRFTYFPIHTSPISGLLTDILYVFPLVNTCDLE